MRPSVIAVLFTVLAYPVQAGDAPVTVENSGRKDVDALVLQLVSQRPAPYRSGDHHLEIDTVNMPYMTPAVSNSISKLKQMGPSIFPALVKHLGDDRYSYSSISAAWDNFTVSDAVIEVLSDGHFMYSGYKGRETPSGSAGYLSFEDYLIDKRPEKWAVWAKDETRLEIQMDFIEWCVAKEKLRGFTDADQEKKLLTTYERAREKVRKEYSGQGAAKGSQQFRPVTNSTPSAAGSRH